MRCIFQNNPSSQAAAYTAVSCFPPSLSENLHPAYAPNRKPPILTTITSNSHDPCPMSCNERKRCRVVDVEDIYPPVSVEAVWECCCGGRCGAEAAAARWRVLASAASQPQLSAASARVWADVRCTASLWAQPQPPAQDQEWLGTPWTCIRLSPVITSSSGRQPPEAAQCQWSWSYLHCNNPVRSRFIQL